MIAVFDEDGVCLVVTSCDDAPGGVIRAEVPRGTKPGPVWWDGHRVRPSMPADLPIPDALDVDDPPVTIDLPEGAVAEVNGVRQRGQITLVPAEVGALHVVLRGALSGSYVVKVQTYVERRRAAYPPIGDQLDALWKGLSELPPVSPEVQAMLNTIQAVKTANPKPES